MNLLINRLLGHSLSIRIWVLAILVTAVVTSCGDSDENGSESKAFVTQKQKDHAFAIIKDIDYIPFSYALDGCYARALYMSMELAAHKIPSSFLYLFGKLTPSREISWRYHVAPFIVEPSLAKKAFVLDPSLSDSPLLISEWIDKSDFLSNDAVHRFYVTEGAIYVNDTFNAIQPFSSRNSSIYEKSELENTSLIKSFDELDNFQGKDIDAACDIMYNYLAKTKLAPPMLMEKRKLLLSHTRRLINSLKKLDKLEDHNYSFKCLEKLTTSDGEQDPKSQPVAVKKPRPCVTAYEHVNYGGKRWVFFCGDNPTKWNDKISSFKIPEGYSIKVCEHTRSDRRFPGRCRTYKGNVKWVGDKYNDIISHIELKWLNP